MMMELAGWVRIHGIGQELNAREVRQRRYFVGSFFFKSFKFLTLTVLVTTIDALGNF